MVPIDWNAMNALYECFVVFPFSVPGPASLILVPTRRRFCLSVVSDGAVVAVACIGVVLVFGFFLLGSSLVVCCDVIVVVIFGGGVIISDVGIIG